jgi:uncharacterized protein YukE
MNLQRRHDDDDTIAQDGETVHATLMFMDAQQREVQSRYQGDGSGDDDARREAQQARADRMARTADAWKGNSSTLVEERYPTLQPSAHATINQLRGEPGIPPQDQNKAEVELAREERRARTEEAWRNPPLGYAIRSF